MAKLYTKGTTVVDEVLSGAERYDIKENAGTAFKSNMQIVLATGVSVAGTAINAARLNNIETGIDTLDTKVADATDLLTTGGTSTAYTLTTTGVAALATGEAFRVKFHATAGATPTLNRDSKGAKSLKYYDTAGAKQACTSSQIVANMIINILYDGTDYVLLNVDYDHTQYLLASGLREWDQQSTPSTPASNKLLAYFKSDNRLYRLDSNGKETSFAQEWIPVNETWTYASASTITVPTNATTRFTKGVKIRFKQGGGYKYFVANVVAATLLTVVVNTDHTVANSAITDIAISYNTLPDGFPASWTFTSTLTASTTNPTGLTTTGKYVVFSWGIKCFVSSVAGASPTNGSGYYIWSVPFASALAGVGPMHISDANVGRYTGSAYQTGVSILGITSAGLVTNASPIATLQVNDSFDFSIDLVW